MDEPTVEGGGRVAAYLDMDGTLLAVNSARLWLRREWRSGRVTPWQVVRAVLFLMAYRAGAVDIEHATREALETVAGLREDEVREWTRSWFEEEVTQHVAPGARPTVEAHRRAGHVLVLLTSASSYEAELAAELFGLDACLSSHYVVRDGTFTGEPILPLCYGAGKIRFAEDHAREVGIDVGASYFYTDSFTDLPMLERVVHPRVVCPDVRLRLAARRRGWPVLDWSTSRPRILLEGTT
jgi:HAD superfamily hydrolase (TIGR01490 family)